MSTTRNIMSSALFARPFLGYQPVNISNGEPALQAANMVKQTILSPPFRWVWNRNGATFQLDPLSTEWPQDTLLDLDDFGFLENVWLEDTEGNVKEIEVKQSLSAESSVQRPASAAAQLVDLDNGNIILRLNAVPDQAYTIGMFYQKESVQVTSLASQWGPIPDSMSYVYDWGFLAMVSMILKDARFPIFWQKFTSHLLGAQDGLTQMQRNIFLGNWLEVLTAQERAQSITQQGVQARAI